MTTIKTKKLLRAIRKALTFLNKLGGACEIAHYFEVNGLRGRVGSCSTCPVANYLSLVTGEGVNVGSDFATPVDFPNKVSLPPNVVEFVRTFDKGQYANCKLYTPPTTP